jgi:hypothetical protein
MIGEQQGLVPALFRNNLALVAEILRQKSLDSTKIYTHPTPETNRIVIELIEGGDSQ